MATSARTTVETRLGAKAQALLEFHSPKIPKERLHLPGPDFIDRVWAASDRNIRVLTNLQRIYGHGRLGKTGYLSILPVDQGIEHSAGASFAKNPDYLGAVARKYAHKIPFIMKLNHNELLTYPNKFDQVFFSTVKVAYDMGAAAVGATIYFGSDQSDRQIVEVSRAFAHAHELGMGTILWCYMRNSAFKKDKDYHLSADLTGQANHLGVTIEADIIKQKLAENNGGYLALNIGDSSYGKFDKRIYTDLASDHPIDLCRYQVANCFMGRSGLINSGGASGANDFEEAVATAVINKRAGGTGLISGRKAFQRPLQDGIQLLNTVQDVYLSDEVTVA